MAKPLTLPGIRHVRPVEPVDFPPSDPEWDVPEGLRHNRMRAVLCGSLERHLGPSNRVGSNEFVYFDGIDRRRCLAPDTFVKLGLADEVTDDSYKTWEKGTPEVCVEVLSPSDTQKKLTFDETFLRYRALGTRELVVFEFDAPEGRRLRAWDRIEGDLVERVVEGETTPCVTLGLQWVLAPCNTERLPVTLRLAKPSGELVLTGLEAARAERSVIAAERAVIEGERAVIEGERAVIEGERAVIAAERAELEREAARLRNLLAERTR